MKKFANAEIEVVKFDNAVIATSGCAAVGPHGDYWNEPVNPPHGFRSWVWNSETNQYVEIE